MATKDALRTIWLPGISGGGATGRITVDRFLRSRNAHLHTQPTDGHFKIYVPNQKNIPELFVSEAGRFSSASFESLVVEATRPEFPRSTGWLLIRAYYAAFFAFHSLMRLRGWACSRLTKENCVRLEKDLKVVFGVDGGIESGLYLLKAYGSSPEISCDIIANKKGGSHEAAWSLLPEFLRSMTTDALEGSVDQEAAQSLLQFVDVFNRKIKKRGGVIWLTRVRNLVNYSHEYGAWFPYDSSTCDNDRIFAAIRRWRGDISDVFSVDAVDELVEFCEVCAFLVCLLHTTIKDLVFRSKANSQIRISTGRLLDASLRLA